MQEHDHDHDSHADGHHTPTAHYYQQVSRNKIIGRVLFIVIAIVVAIVLILLFRGIRSRSVSTVDPLTANAVLSQGNVKYVALGEQFNLVNDETAFIKETDASIKILGYAYTPCANDPKCVQKGIQVNYVLVDKGIQYKNEYGKPVNTDLFPYDVRVIQSDYQTFAAFVVYLKGKPGQTATTVSTTTSNNGSTSGTTTNGSTNTQTTTGTNSTTGTSTTTTPPAPAVTWKKITIAGRDFSYPSDWETPQKLEPSLCQGVILTKKSGLSEKAGEVTMYEDIACRNDQVRDPANYDPLVRTVRVHGVRVFVTVQKDDATKKQIDQIIAKL